MAEEIIKTQFLPIFGSDVLKEELPISFKCPISKGMKFIEANN